MTEQEIAAMDTDDLLDCPRIEEGESFTRIMLHRGVFGEIERRLRNADILKQENSRLRGQLESKNAHYEAALLNWNQVIAERDALKRDCDILRGLLATSEEFRGASMGICCLCGTTMYGIAIGAGTGDGKQLAHPHCYERREAGHFKRQCDALRGLLRETLPAIHPDDSRYERITDALKEPHAG